MSSLCKVYLNPSFSGFSRETRLLVGGSLGRLARFLRILGYDTEYEEVEEERLLAKQPMAEGRIIITKAQDITITDLHKALGIIQFSSQVTEFEDQVALLIKRGFNLEIPEKTYRCTNCNTKLQTLEKDEVEELSLKNLIPEQSWKIYDRFYYCKKCNKMYWLGSHWKNIKLTIRKAKERVEKNAY